MSRLRRGNLDKRISPANEGIPTADDLVPDDSNRFGPDSPNVRADDPPVGQVIPTAPPVPHSRYPLHPGDFAPDEG